ncbi:MAG: hypothetical protein AAGF19_11110 [Pseudomonadota bacterium]
MMWDISQVQDDPQSQTVNQKIAKALNVLSRLVMPVAALSLWLFLAFLTSDRTITSFDFLAGDLASWNPGSWLTLGHLLLPIAFFLVVLTNRRYGAAYAAGQVGLAWIVLAIVTTILLRYGGEAGSDGALPDLRQAAAFFVAILLAQLFSIEIFDKTRGPIWWPAPFNALFWGGFVLAALYYPMAFWGTERDWLQPMVVFFGLMAVAALAMLLPYHLLRAAVRPTGGYNSA